MQHCGTQRIETERLILRQFAAADAADLLELWIADPRVQSEYGEPVYETQEAVEALLQKWITGYENSAFYRWAMVEKASGRCIGQIAFCRVYEDCKAAEIEYCVSVRFWGRGYASEALQAVIDYIFAHTDFVWLEAYHRAENRNSGRVLEKSCMERTDNVERFRRAGEMPQGEICYRVERRYLVETEHLKIGEWSTALAAELCRISQDADTRKYLKDEVFESETTAREWISRMLENRQKGEDTQAYPIFLKDETLIGHVAVCPLEDWDEEAWEIEYHICEGQRGHGYAAEAVTAFLPIIMETMGLRTMRGFCPQSHEASVRVLEQCGFRKYREKDVHYYGEPLRLLYYIFEL